jgi:hypothetical protein
MIMIIDHTKLYMRYITMRQTAIDDRYYLRILPYPI